MQGEWARGGPMSEKETHPGDAAELRRRAEESAWVRAASQPENAEALPPEETRRALHELRVHQICTIWRRWAISRSASKV